MIEHALPSWHSRKEDRKVNKDVTTDDSKWKEWWGEVGRGGGGQGGPEEEQGKVGKDLFWIGRPRGTSETVII